VPVSKSLVITGILQTIATFFNNCATLMFLFCYIVLTEPTITQSSNGGHKTVLEWHRWLAVLIVFTILEAACMVLSLDIVPNSFGLDPDRVANSFNWISGVGSATVMGLFIGRMDSKFLECPSWFLVLLYFYVAIQPLFALLGSAHMWW